MKQFDAAIFHRIGYLLGTIFRALETVERQGWSAFPDITPADLSMRLGKIAGCCREISLKQSAKFAEAMIGKLSVSQILATETKTRIESLQEIIFNEMEDSLFLWVPAKRAEFYEEGARVIVGAQCYTRFKSIRGELQEGAKCYALGRYTACAFHLMRSTEAGVKALAKAIGYVPPHNQWDLVFKQMKSEFALKPSLRPAHWQTHGDFLEMIWGDLRAVSKAWRNDIAHLVDTYSEKEARILLTVIPMFLRDLATKMDENGKLY